MEDKQRLGKRSKWMLVATVVAFMFLAILAIMSYNGVSDKTFGVDNFYIGNKGEAVDPKAQYDALYKNVAADAVSCLTTMSAATNPMMGGKNCTWIVDGAVIEKWKEIKDITTDDAHSSMKPFKDGQMIIAPTELKFINANTVQYSQDSISIVASINSMYIIEFNDVKAWWCHIGKDNPTKHTCVVGAGGVNPICAEGYIIGEAKKSTTVNLYKIDADGIKTPCSFKNLFFPS